MQLFIRELDARSQVRIRSYEVPLLQAPGAQPQTEAIVHEHLHAVGSAVHEQISIMSAGCPEHIHNPGKGCIHPRSHVQRLHSQPSCVNADQRNSSRSNMAQTCADEAGHCTTIVVEPRRTSRRIDPSSNLPARATGTNPGPFSIGTLVAFSARFATGAPVLSASTTQRRSRFAFTPRDIAIAAIETPGCRHADTASDLNDSLWRRRRRRASLA
jgi:hypothetical protein